MIAAITSCTNTSNPSVMVAAGLLARNAVRRGLSAKPWVKTSLAPGSKVVTEYLDRAGLTESLEQLGFNLVGYGCTTCIGNSGPLAPEISAAVSDADLAVVSVLSGNRNFEGRINPDVKMNYLASPPLCVAYALAGTMDLDIVGEPLGVDEQGQDVYLRDIWPSEREIAQTIEEAVQADMFRKSYAEVFAGDERWNSLQTPQGERFAWDELSTYVRLPPYFQDMPAQPPAVQDVRDARVLALLGDSVTTDHISPAGSIKRDGPAGAYLQEQGVAPRDFNSYGSRRGNHEVMMRGTFANIRLRNQLAPGTEGGVTRHLGAGAGGAGEPVSIYDAAMRYMAEGTPLRRARGQGVRLGLLTRLGREGDEAARRTRGDRRELRAHPPLEPRRHGRAAAAVPRWPERRVAGSDGRGALLDRGHGRGDGRRRASAQGGRRDGRARRRGDARFLRARAHRHAARGRVLPPRRHPAVRAAPAVARDSCRAPDQPTSRSPGTRSKWRRLRVISGS